MSRNVQLVLLCEDRQHETFARRFLANAGWSTRRLRVELAPDGRGSAEQFVRERFPIELASFRTRSDHVDQALIVVVDGDRGGVAERLDQLADSCRAEGVEPRKPGERVAVFIPSWNIESWLAYLNGDSVDETRANYPRLERERDCQRHVDVLFEMCNKKALRQPAPTSLDAACVECQTRLGEKR